jgi:hypothetical protein
MYAQWFILEVIYNLPDIVQKVVNVLTQFDLGYGLESMGRVRYTEGFL